MEKNKSPSSPSDTPQERMRKRKESFQCQSCGRTFRRAWSLVQHLWTHTGNRPFRCDLCGSCFNSVGNLQKHQRMKHNFKTGKNNNETDAALNGFDNNKAKSEDEKETDGVLNELELCQKEAHGNAAKRKPDENETTSDKCDEKSKIEAANNNNNNLSCVCNKCGRRFSNKSRLMTHLRFHEGKPIHRCLYCGSEFMSKNLLKIHERIHTGEKPYKCDHCHKVFHILAKLYAHTRKYHRDASRASASQSQSFTCYECKEEFPTKRLLIEHHSTNHKKERYQCKYCQKKFLYKRFLAEHERSHSRDGNAPDADTPVPLLHQRKPSANAMRSAYHKSFECENCGKSFQNKTQLQLHQLSHIGKEPYKCKYCTMAFLSESFLVLHERSHTGEQPYKCDYCGRWFGILGNLYGHIRTQHPDKELPKKERFDYLKQPHLQAPSPAPPAAPCVSQPPPASSAKSSSHTSPQPSPKFVSEPSSLPSPQSPPNRYKPFKCEYCDKGFKTKCHLVEHRYIHTGKPLTCGVCGHGFIRRKKLEIHQKCHTGRDLYTCGECGYKFASLQKLKTHKLKKHPDRANVSNDSYECEYCDETFTSYFLLRKHMEIHPIKKAPYKRDKEKKETAPTSGPFEEDSEKQQQLTCQDCGTLVKLSCTTLSNVFAVTQFSNVKCFLKNHTVV